MVGRSTNTVGSNTVAVLPNCTNSGDGAHFGRPWYQRHESGWMCHVSRCAGAREALHSRHTAKIDIPRASGGRPPRLWLSPEGLGLSPGAWGIHFWECQACLGYGSAPGPTLKRPSATLASLVGRAPNTVGNNAFAVLPSCNNPVDGPHFGQLWCNGTDLVCHVSGYGSQMRLLGAGPGEAYHSRHVLETDLFLESQGAVPRL